jgi:hypothetical protein
MDAVESIYVSHSLLFLAVGGASSGQYAEFRKYCCLAFNILRQHANLILTLLR